jgi:hypothetical protein
MTDHDSTLAGPRAGVRNRLALAAGAVVGAGALVFGGVALTNAYFTSQAAIGEQEIDTATVEITAGISSVTTPIEVTNALPGDEWIETLVIKNTGTADVYFSMGPVDVEGDEDLIDALQVGAVFDGETTITHSLAEWASGSYQGNALAAGATAEVSVLVSLPVTEEPQNDLQGDSAAFDIQFTAVQQEHYDGITTPTWTPGD